MLVLLAELQQTLEREHRCLAGTEPSSLAEIVALKSALLAQLEGVHPGIDVSDDIKKMLQQCKSLNQQNQMLANQRIKLVRHTVALAKQGNGDELYAANGRLQKRPLSRALVSI